MLEVKSAAAANKTIEKLLSLLFMVNQQVI
jgi:hypothetical protein